MARAAERETAIRLGLGSGHSRIPHFCTESAALIG